MAKMLPYPIAKFDNHTEEKLYRLFEHKLNDDYTVLYSRSWTQIANKHNPDIECDFIILKLREGIIVVEAKGGKWERQGGRWLAYEKPAKDPVFQAKSNRYALQKLLKKPFKWGSRFFPLSYALALPDTRFPDGFDKSGLPPILTNNEIDNVNEWVTRAMRDCLQQNYPHVVSEEMYDYVINTLLKDYTMNLKEVLDITEKELVTLTNQQLELDQSLQNIKKLTIQGCAGSGKTLMALRQAKRLSQTPTIRNILFTCINLELGKWLQEQTLSIRDRCTTKPFLVFCEEMLAKHNILTGKETKNQSYYDGLPAKMLEIIDTHHIKFDAIIVDEGQSFNTDWWAVIDQMLSDKAKSYRYIFYDNLQKIYDEKENQVPGEDESFGLTVNVRNTANIHHKTVEFLPEDGLLPRSNNIKGEAPWFCVYDDEESMKLKLQEILTKLIRDEKVSAKDIIVLRGKKKNSRLNDEEKLGSYILTSLESESNPSAIRFTTIQSFRGMERKVVILTELDKEVTNIKSLNYLGGSRAKTLLVYLISNKVNPSLLEILKENCQVIFDD